MEDCQMESHMEDRDKDISADLLLTIECPICKNIYREDGDGEKRIPIMLPCAHSMCLGCTSKLRRRQCPMCRMNIPFEELPTNYMAIEIVQMLRKRGKLESKLNIFVKDLKGKSFAFNVSPDDTIAKLKGLIQDKLGVPHIEQRLVCAGRQLEDDRAVADYAHVITQGCTVQIILRSMGGYFSWGSGGAIVWHEALETVPSKTVARSSTM